MFQHYIFERFLGAHFDLTSFYETLARRDRLAGFVAHEPYYEIGSSAGLQELEAKLSEKKLEFSQSDLHIETYLDETIRIAKMIDQRAIATALFGLQKLQQTNGRLFVLGVGGSAANASHAVNDFRKIAGIEAYAPTDNVAELTARTNDVSWEAVFIEWLKTSRLTANDALLVLSVGGGSDTTSTNLVWAMKYANAVGAAVIAIVSRDGGAAALMADVSILVPVVNEARITPHAETWQSLICHLLVNGMSHAS